MINPDIPIHLAGSFCNETVHHTEMLIQSEIKHLRKHISPITTEQNQEVTWQISKKLTSHLLTALL